MPKDFYSILEIPVDTPKEEIRLAYLRLARKYHPDLNEDPKSRDRFEKINQAYSILSNEESRTFYDLFCEGAEDIDESDESQELYPYITVAMIIGILSIGIFGGYGLVLYMPALVKGIETLINTFSETFSSILSMLF
jgi:DnaJ-class molecular chaperone